MLVPPKFVGWRVKDVARWGVSASIENYDPHVVGGSRSSSSAWISIGQVGNPYDYVQIGWAKDALLGSVSRYAFAEWNCEYQGIQNYCLQRWAPGGLVGSPGTFASYRIVNDGSAWKVYRNSYLEVSWPLGYWTANDVQVATEVHNNNDQVPGGAVIANKLSFKSVQSNGVNLDGSLMRDDANIQGYYRVSTHEFQVWDKACTS
jgi:hypothetical protein